MCYTETQMTSELLDQPRFTGEPTKIFDLFDAEKRQLYAVPLHDQCRARGAARIFQPDNHAHYTVDLWAAGSAGKVNIFSGIGAVVALEPHRVSPAPAGKPKDRAGKPHPHRRGPQPGTEARAAHGPTLETHQRTKRDGGGSRCDPCRRKKHNFEAHVTPKMDHPADRQRQDEVAQPRLRSAGPRVEAEID